MFKDDENTGLSVKITKKQPGHQTSSPTKRKAKPTGKRTGGRPPAKSQTRGMTLQSKVPMQKATTTTTTLDHSSSHADDNHSTTSSEDRAPSPKRQNKKGTPLTPPEPQRNST